MENFITTKGKKNHVELYYDSCRKKVLVISRKWNKSVFGETILGTFTPSELKKFVATIIK